MCLSLVLKVEATKYLKGPVAQSNIAQQGPCICLSIWWFSPRWDPSEIGHIPVIASRAGGMTDHLNENSSIAIENKGDVEFVKDLVKVLNDLYENRQSLHILQKQAVIETEKYWWSASWQKILLHID